MPIAATLSPITVRRLMVLASVEVSSAVIGPREDERAITA